MSSLLLLLCFSCLAIGLSIGSPLLLESSFGALTTKGSSDVALVHSDWSPEFLPFLAQSALYVISTEFPSIEIPDTVQRVNVPVVGDITLTLNKTRIDGIQVAYDQAWLTANASMENTLDFSASNVSVRASSQWKWWKGVMHSHGLVNISIANCSLAAQIRILPNNSRVSLDFSNVRVSLGDVSIKISESKWTWLYSLIKDALAGPLKSVAQAQLIEQLQSTVPAQLNSILMGLPVDVPVWKDVSVGLGVSQLVIDERGVRLDNDGAVHLKNGNALCPYQRPRSSSTLARDASRSSKMVRFEFDEVFMNCALYMLHLDGFFTRLVPIHRVSAVDNGASLLISLLKAPSVKLTGDGKVLVDMRDVTLNFSMPSERRGEPLSVVLRLQAQLGFELRVVSSSRFDSSLLFQKTSSNDEQQTHATTRSSKSLILSSIKSELVDFSGHTSRVHELYSVGIQALSQHIPDALMSIIENNTFVPVPIGLPWPLSKIRIQDVEMDVLDGKWRIEADFSLAPEN